MIEQDLYSCLNPENSVKNKKSLGSTSHAEVVKQIKRLKKIVNSK